MISFARAFLAMLADFRRARGWPAALKRALGSLRVLALPGLMRRMAADGYLQRVERKRGVDGEPWDPFHFISHPGYLVQGLSWTQRFEAALYHYRYEGETFNEAMLDQVYSPEGFLLWAAEVDGHQFAMRLGLAPHGSVEGDLGLQLIADGRCLINMNFIWADGATFGRHSGPTIFITRSQTHHWPELATFRACFKQNSPPYFCLAALSGISQALGLSDLHAVHHAAQLSYEPKYESGFRNSYDEFWKKFNGVHVTPQAFRLALPLELRDLSELKSKHRSRAEGRRRSWGEVGQSAAAVLAQHLRGNERAAPPCGDETVLSLKARALCAAALLPEGLPPPLLQVLV